MWSQKMLSKVLKVVFVFNIEKLWLIKIFIVSTFCLHYHLPQQNEAGEETSISVTIYIEIKVFYLSHQIILNIIDVEVHTYYPDALYAVEVYQYVLVGVYQCQFFF